MRFLPYTDAVHFLLCPPRPDRLPARVGERLLPAVSRRLLLCLSLLVMASWRSQLQSLLPLDRFRSLLLRDASLALHKEYVHVSQADTSIHARSSFQPLGPDERLGPNDLVAIDTEFVSLAREEVISCLRIWYQIPSLGPPSSLPNARSDHRLNAG